MICLTPKLSQNSFVNVIQNKEKNFFLQKKSFLRKRRNGRLNKKTKRMLFNYSRYGDWEGPYNVNKKAR